MKRIAAILLLLVCFACGPNRPLYPEADYPSRSVTVDGVEYKYRVFVPKDRVDGQRLPVMLYLHGSNRRGNDNQAQVEDLGENIRAFPDNWHFIVVFPQCRENTFWAGLMMDQALAALDQTVNEFDGDKDRLYLAGYSMGGFGVWQMAITHPEKFTALVSVAGGVEPLGAVSDDDMSILSPQVRAAASAPDTIQAYAEALRSVPAWIVHGERDEAVPVDASRNLASALKAAGNTDVNYVELAGIGHGSVTQAFSEPKLFEWLANQTKRSNK